MKRIWLLLLLFVCILSGCTAGEEKTKKDYSDIVENPNISIPGYERLDFTAGKKKQSVNFYNPDTNTCYFCLSLVLNSINSEGERETLWTSGYIEPGEEIRAIKLNKELESGDYPAILKYECFSLKDETPLNRSNVELIVHVR